MEYMEKAKEEAEKNVKGKKELDAIAYDGKQKLEEYNKSYKMYSTSQVKSTKASQVRPSS